jgi:hypothetical protein
MDIETARMTMIKNAASAVQNSAAALIADFGSTAQERDVLLLATEISEYILEFSQTEPITRSARTT